MSSNVIDATLRLLALWALAATVAIVMIALLRPMVRKAAGARAVLRLWWILPMALLITAWPKEVRVAVPVITGSLQLLDPGTPASNAGPMRETAPPAEVALPAVRHAIPPITPWACLLAWAVGALMLSAWLAWRQWRYQQSIAWHGLRGVLPRHHTPAVIGLLSPRLVLPEDFNTRFSSEERRLIRLHEAVHQIRRDGLANLCMSVLRAVLWFHPLVHWAAKALGDDQESACDEVVVSRHPDRIRVYAEALMRSADGAPRLHAPLVSQWLAFHPVVERVAMLKHYRQLRPKRYLANWALLAGGLSSAAAVYALQPEKVVSVAVPLPGELMSPLGSAAQPANSGLRWNGMLDPVLRIVPGVAAGTVQARSPHAVAVVAPEPPQPDAASNEGGRAASEAPPRVSVVSEPAEAPATSGTLQLNYLTLELRRGDRLIASPALVTADGRAAAIRIEDGDSGSVAIRAIPSREKDGKISIRLEIPAAYPASNEVSIQSAAFRLSPRDTQRVRGEGGLRMLNLVVLPGEQAVVKFGSGPEEEEWRLRVFPIPRFAASNGSSGTEINSITAFACPGGGQTLLPRVMRLLTESTQINAIYRDADSGMIKLVGVAANAGHVSGFLQRLSTDGAFLNVNLLSVIRREDSGSLFQIELALKCAPATQGAAGPASSASPVRTRASNVGLKMNEVKLPDLIGVLGDAMGRKLRGLESLPVETLRLNVMPVDVAQATQALLGCAGFQMVEDAGQWRVRRNELQAADPDLNACAARSVAQGVPAPPSVSRGWPSALNGSFRVAMRIDVGKGLTSQYERSAVLGEVMRLPIAPDVALACTLMGIEESLYLRCTENQDGLPLPKKHVVMERIDSESPQPFEAVTSRGTLAGEVTVKQKPAGAPRTG